MTGPLTLPPLHSYSTPFPCDTNFLIVIAHRIAVIDVFVDQKNKGYVVYRRVLEYYSGSSTEAAEDAFDMRKALTKDPEKKSMVPLKEPITPYELESTM